MMIFLLLLLVNNNSLLNLYSGDTSIQETLALIPRVSAEWS